MKHVELAIVLVSAMAGLVLLARKLQIPYPILLVLGGFALSLAPMPKVTLDPELIFVLLLPPLLYPGAVFIPWRDFRANLRTILLLAIGLVLVTMIATAIFAHHFVGMQWGSAFVLGAIISPSDAVAAMAIVHRLRVPRRLITILEGESLVNDTTAFVAYRFAIVAVVTGSFSLASAGLRFVLVAVGGTLVGVAMGWLVTAIQRRLDDPPVQTTVSLLTPFIAYLAAEAIGVSGVLAVVICGLYYGWRSPEFISARFRLRAYPVWEMVQFLLNGIVFILIGLQLPDVLAALAGRSPGQVVWFATVIFVPMILLRLGWLFAMHFLSRVRRPRAKENGSESWRHVLLVGWTGLRGVDSLVAALAVPMVTAAGAPFPDRDLIFFLTFAVIFGTLVLQGLTLAPAIRWLGVVDDRLWDVEERRARVEANRAALIRVREIAVAQSLEESAVQRLSAEYEDRILQLQSHAEGDFETAPLYSPDFEKITREALDTERRTILALRNRHVINDEVLRRIQRDIDLAETRLKREHA